MKKLNLNSYVKVKLTDYGYEKLEKFYNIVFYGYEYRIPEADEDGYVTFQLTELMCIFGKDIYVGNTDIPFELDIYVDDMDIVNVENNINKKSK